LIFDIGRGLEKRYPGSTLVPSDSWPMPVFGAGLAGFGLADPKLVGERDVVVGMLTEVTANRPAPGTLLVGDKGFASGRRRSRVAVPAMP
jgi:hypothetical protein